MKIEPNIIKRYKVRKNMQIFYDISNLLTTFQMSYIYHQVTILAYAIFDFENTCAIYTQQEIYICKNYYLCKKVKLVERVQRYTNANMKICQFLRLLMKIICWRFHIKTPFTFSEMPSRDMSVPLMHVQFHNFHKNYDQDCKNY